MMQSSINTRCLRIHGLPCDSFACLQPFEVAPSSYPVATSRRSQHGLRTHHGQLNFLVHERSESRVLACCIKLITQRYALHDVSGADDANLPYPGVLLIHRTPTARRDMEEIWLKYLEVFIENTRRIGLKGDGITSARARSTGYGPTQRLREVITR